MNPTSVPEATRSADKTDTTTGHRTDHVGNCRQCPDHHTPEWTDIAAEWAALTPEEAAYAKARVAAL